MHSNLQGHTQQIGQHPQIQTSNLNQPPNPLFNPHGLQQIHPTGQQPNHTNQI
jgi:hypothetical protein